MDHLHKSTEEQIINSVNKDDENYDGINASLLGKNISDTESDCEILPSQIDDTIEVEEKEHKGIDVSLLGNLSDTESDYESMASEIDDIIEVDEEENGDEDQEVEASNTIEEFFACKENIQWSIVPVRHRGKTRRCNIIKGSCDRVTIPPEKAVNKHVDSFVLFLPDQLFQQIADFTNKKAESVYQERNVNKIWKQTDSIEIKAFIGLLLRAGHLSQDNSSVSLLWDNLYGSPIFNVSRPISPTIYVYPL